MARPASGPNAMSPGDPPAAQSSQATLLLTDLVDSAALTERLGDESMAELWTTHDRLTRDLLRRWRGREIDKSDGFLLLFAEPGDALAFALAYHRALAALTVPLRARAGIHVGSVTVRENRADDVALGAKPVEVDGLAKPVAARVMAIALGGQTLLTEAARLALGDLADRWRLVSHGHWRLKGLPEPLELFEAGDQAGDEAPFQPPPDADKSYRVVRQGELWLPVRALQHSLPAERDAFVGRQSALHGLARRFEQGARLVSVLGVGGTGKTRLVTRFAWTWLGDYPGGVWFCDLAPARGFDGVLGAVAQGLAVPLGKGDPVQQLGHAIAGHGICLLVLDNFEQVARHAEACLGTWLARAPAARFLVTSREVLGIAGEETMALAPLPAAEAETLFMLRADAVRQGFCSSDDDRQAVATLTTLLDGLPLAIELAAARARILPPRALLARMSERFRLLSSGGGRQDRQSTLRAAFDWSWDLLSPADQAALAQLSVFEGGFTLDAAEAVIDLSTIDDERWNVDAVHSLIDKSFVRALDGERFDLLVSVQIYAAEHLATAGRYPGSGVAAVEMAQARHGVWFAALGQERATDAAGVELNNLVAACRRAVRRADADCAVGALEGAWAALKLQGPFKTGVELAAEVCAMPGLADVAALRAHAVHGSACDLAGLLAEAHRQYDRALGLAAAHGDPPRQAELRIGLAGLLAREGRLDEAEAGHHEALALAERSGARALACAALNGLGNVASDHGRLAEAQARYEAALAIARDIGHRRWQGALLGNLGMLQAGLGRLDDARERCHGALEIARSFGDRQREANIQANLGLMLHTQGQVDEAVAASEAALQLARRLGHVRLECIVLCNLGICRTDQGQLLLAGGLYQAALQLARDLGDRRSQGQILGYLGLARARLGDFAPARLELADGEALLREVADQLSLGVLLCARAECEARASQPDASAAALAEARALAAQAAAGAESELGRALRRAGEVVAGEPAVAPIRG